MIWEELLKKYDYLIVGAGLFGSTFANLAHKQGKKVLVIDRRDHIAGNIYTEEVEGIQVHRYGAHIFHTDYKDVWDYVNSFVEFNRYTNSPVARINNEIYNMPFNMNTFAKIWNDVFTPEDAMRHINEEKKEITGEPKKLEEQAISLVGRTIYEKLVKGYTKLVEKMLDGIEVKLNTNFFDNIEEYKEIADKIVYTGPIDEYFNYSLGSLDWRSLKFDTKVLDQTNYQGNAVVNYTGHEVDYTRVIEHKHFEFDTTSPKTVITFEYPADYKEGMEKYYTVNDDKNNGLADKYRELSKKEENVIFGGRLAEYKYYDMDDVIKSAFECVKEELK